jgi:hypothetical protein
VPGCSEYTHLPLLFDDRNQLVFVARDIEHGESTDRTGVSKAPAGRRQIIPGGKLSKPRYTPLPPMPSVTITSVNWLAAAFAVCPLLGIASAQQTTDDFEAPTLSKIWDTSRFTDGAVRIQSAIVRAGHAAAEVTVHHGDKFEAGIAGNSDSERAELMEARSLVSRERTTYEYAFSMFFPENFPIVPTRLVIAQWKQYCPESHGCSDDSPVLAIRYISGALHVTQNIGKKVIVLWEEKAEFRGRWLDFRLQVRFSPESDGTVKVWLGNKTLTTFHGITANDASDTTGYPSPSYFYFKMGLYRNVMPEPMTVYIDEYRKHRL